MRNVCPCCFDSQVAYIRQVSNKREEKISILDYVNHSDEEYILVCEKGKPLCKQVSNRGTPFFRHISTVNVNTPMSAWHLEWQERFEKEGAEIEKIIGTRIADIHINNIVVEVQYSNINKDNVVNRYKNYTSNGSELVWVIEASESVTVTNTGDNIYEIHFLRDSWKYEKFITMDYIFLDHSGFLYKINPSKVRSSIFPCNGRITTTQFVSGIVASSKIPKNELMDHGTIYVNQRGAGCGKTYESIQLIAFDQRFEHKEVFIYLTKMHSAKEVIFSELSDQVNDGRLDDFVFYESDRKGKQYKITIGSNKRNKNVEILIGTIDSFTYALGDQKVKSNDYFKGIVKSICGGYVRVSKNGIVRYAQGNYMLNRRCLIVIDEAQDLDKIYISGFKEIIKKTGIDTYIIGDKLQSIWGQDNIFTYVENCEGSDMDSVKFVKSAGINKVMRFHNVQFKEFVNQKIQFSKYNLPEISGICTLPNCKYVHEDSTIPYKVCICVKLEKKQVKTNHIKFIEDVEHIMNNEIKLHRYKPNNFLFIFPILANVPLASELESFLQDFWINKFTDPEYCEGVLNQDEKWKKKSYPTKFTKYSFLHTSVEGRPINVKESDGMTRILSIHSSKGMGCEVVFLVDISEYSLKIFSDKQINLVYESLLHVALTRQKKSLYVMVTKDLGADLCKRFINNIPADTRSLVSMSELPHKSFKMRDISSHISSSSSDYEQLFASVVSSYDIILKENMKKGDSDLVDWDHHCIRNSIMFFYFLKNVYNQETLTDEATYKFDQFIVVIDKLARLNVIILTYRDYYEGLRKINKNIKSFNSDKNKTIPILQLDPSTRNPIYVTYAKELSVIVMHIQQKLRKIKQNRIFPSLCALESVIFYHIYQVIQKGQYATVTAMNIYNIYHYFKECGNSFSSDHTELYSCLCHRYISKSNDVDGVAHLEIRRFVTEFYKTVEQIDILYRKFRDWATSNVGKNIEYNPFYKVFLTRSTDSFSGWSEFEIIANTEDAVIFFYIVPSYSILNYSTVITDIAIRYFNITNTRNKGTSTKPSTNYSKLYGKRVIPIIFTFDCRYPIILDFFNISQSGEDVIRKLIGEQIKNKHVHSYPLIYSLYKECYDMIAIKGGDIRRTIHNSIEKFKESVIIKDVHPEYIVDYLKTLRNMPDEDTFIDGLKAHFEWILDNYLNPYD